MKISQLISVLEDVKNEYGDKYIWSLNDLDFPCPREFTIDLSSKLKRTDHGFLASNGRIKTVFRH